MSFHNTLFILTPVLEYKILTNWFYLDENETALSGECHRSRQYRWDSLVPRHGRLCGAMLPLPCGLF